MIFLVDVIRDCRFVLFWLWLFPGTSGMFTFFLCLNFFLMFLHTDSKTASCLCSVDSFYTGFCKHILLFRLGLLCPLDWPTDFWWWCIYLAQLAYNLLVHLCILPHAKITGTPTFMWSVGFTIHTSGILCSKMFFDWTCQLPVRLLSLYIDVQMNARRKGSHNFQPAINCPLRSSHYAQNSMFPM